MQELIFIKFYEHGVPLTKPDLLANTVVRSSVGSLFIIRQLFKLAARF